MVSEADSRPLSNLARRDGDLLRDLARRGGDVASLLRLASLSDSAQLHVALKRLGFSRMGDRLKAAAALADIAAQGKMAPVKPSVPAGGASHVDVPAAAAARVLVGRVVLLRGLAGRAELNGRRGVCERYEERSGRCVVRLVDLAELLLVKPRNLRAASPGDAAEVTEATEGTAAEAAAEAAEAEAEAEAEASLTGEQEEEEEDICMM